MSREKQIEEMAKSIASTPIGTVKPDLTLTEMGEVYKGEFILRIAKHLYDEDYRKQSENVIELPCKIGDDIWYIDKKYTVQKAEVTCIDIRSTSRHIIATRYVWETEETIKLALMFERLNVDYWLTKEEAEEALAKMKGGAE